MKNKLLLHPPGHRECILVRWHEKKIIAITCAAVEIYLLSFG